MPAGVLPLSEHLRKDFRFLRSLSISQVVIGALAIPFALTFAPLQTAMILTGILAYGLAKVHRFRSADTALKQVRLEERFFRQHLDEDTLKDCLRRSEHLWDESHTLRGLRGAQTIALPRLLSREEKIRLVQQKFHSTFRTLTPSRLVPEIVIPFLAFGWTFMFDHTDGSRWATFFVVAAVSAVLMELAYVQRVYRLRRHLDGFERALSIWTLAKDFLFRSVPATPRPYRHELYYRTEPVFSIRRAIYLRKAQF